MLSFLNKFGIEVTELNISAPEQPNTNLAEEEIDYIQEAYTNIVTENNAETEDISTKSAAKKYIEVIGDTLHTQAVFAKSPVESYTELRA